MFPEVERVIYEENPLARVVCQLQVPELLEIGQNDPVEFQREIRGKYPIFESRSSGDDGNPSTYEFISLEGHWKVTLSTEYLALTTSAYYRWEDFEDRLDEVRSLFEDVYDVPQYTRIGLRYTDVIDRGEIGRSDTEWHELLREEIAGLSVAERFRDGVVQHEQRTVLEVEPADPEIRVGLMYGIGVPEQADEEVALIDADLFSPTPTSPDDARGTIDSLHKYSGRVFRACITDELHDALDPQPVDE